MHNPDRKVNKQPLGTKPRYRVVLCQGPKLTIARSVVYGSHETKQALEVIVTELPWIAACLPCQCCTGIS